MVTNNIQHSRQMIIEYPTTYSLFRDTFARNTQIGLFAAINKLFVLFQISYLKERKKTV